MSKNVYSITKYFLSERQERFLEFFSDLSNFTFNLRVGFSHSDKHPLGISMILGVLNILFGLSHEFPSLMFRPFGKCVLQYRSRGFYTFSEDVGT